MLIAAAAGGGADRGWGGPVAWIVGGVVCAIIWRVDKEIRIRKGMIDNPSPTPPTLPAAGESPQLPAVSSQDPRETAGGETPWYGRIVRRGNAYYRQIAHVAKTGDSLPKQYPQVEAYEPPGEGEEEIDLLLDDGEEEVPIETAEQYATRCLGMGFKPALVAKALQEAPFNKSRPTAYRIIKDIRDAGAPPSNAA